MEKETKHTTHYFILSLCLSLSGLVIGELCGLTFLGIILAGAGCFVMMLASVLVGALCILDMADAKLAYILDGKNELKISLSIGCFTYTRTIPTEISIQK